ncbi:MAG: hypothetical protein JNM82_07900 [Rhodocyclaceae bacterium]|nr:hypothetical protein [Rhodocyclaceae bacterium]
MKIIETLLTGALRAPGLGPWFERRLEGLHRSMVRALRRARRDRVRPREWSNAELRRLAPLYDGEVINVSGWRDEDKAGGSYRDYFTRAASYAVSNYSGDRGTANGIDGIFLDLEGETPPELARRFQVAFNHTTLEHIYDIRRAVAGICALSHDTAILVTPFLQAVHYIEGSFGDWWRPTPACMARLLEEQGFTTVYQACNDNPWHMVYVITVATRQPEKYRDRFPPVETLKAGVGHFVLD